MPNRLLRWSVLPDRSASLLLATARSQPAPRSLRIVPGASGLHRMRRRLAALDVGDKRIGVAVSDGLRLIAQPLGTVERRSLAADCAAIEKMLETYDVEKIIAGLPLNSNGQEGE